MFCFTDCLRPISHWLLPHYCPLCLAPSKDYLCPECDASLTRIGSACRICSLPLTLPMKEEAPVCGNCLRHTPYFDNSHCLLIYNPVVASCIAAFKYQNTLPMGHYLCQLFAQQTLRPLPLSQRPDYIVAIPSHWRTHIQRGFNPAAFIATHISKELNIPILPALIKTRLTSAQKTLNKKEREKNLAASFRVNKARELKNKHIAIVDDVMTTTATANLAANVLKKHGAKHISIWALARTPKPVK